jgi:hypothetical protein
MLRSLSPLSDPTTPWPKSRRSKAPAPAVELARRIAPRRKAGDQRLRILERLTTGLSVAHIARLEKLTVRRVQQNPRRHARKPRDRPSRRHRPVASGPAQRRNDRHAYDDDGGRSSSGRQNDPTHARTRSLSRLRAGPNSPARAPATRGAGGAATIDQSIREEKVDAKFSAPHPLEIAENRERISETRTHHRPSLRGALATKQSRGRVMRPLGCFAALAMKVKLP